MLLGVGFGLLACALWGLTYLLPIVLPGYDTLYISIARAIVMGLTALLGLWIQKAYLSKISFKDWKFAFVLTMIGNLIQPWFLFTAIQYAGVPLAATFFGLIPVLVAIIANERDRKKGKRYLPNSQLVLPLGLILLGLAFSNYNGLVESFSSGNSAVNFAIGTAFAIASTVAWTWYPIKNADWLLEHPKVSPVFFTSMQCSLLLPFGLVLYVLVWYLKGDMPQFLGPQPVDFVGWSLFAGVMCSFVATALWNAMSQRVPTALVGQMLVFETIFSVVWAHVYEWKLPPVSLVVGMACLVGGVVYALKLFSALEEKDKNEIVHELPTEI
ncbi:DMT family transporter [uncultured Turicimonas sp.]|uniref:DMT family transporter n=1 Tax=uncultured Turicimonas sp. TaxID=1918607 RepID=UPI00280415B1|nr:DMT family transporter [uncultured Turicimonas sp.]